MNIVFTLLKNNPYKTATIVISLCILTIAFLNRFDPIQLLTGGYDKPYFVLLEPPRLTLIPFQVESKAPVRTDFESIVFLRPPRDSTNTININLRDQIKRIVFDGPSETRYIIPEVNCMFKIQNIGNAPGKLVLLAIGSSLELNHVLREECYKHATESEEINRFDKFEIRTILKDSVDSVSYKQLPLIFHEDTLKKEVVIHLLLVYENGDRKLFDTYYWLKYKMHNTVIEISTELVEQQVREHMFNILFITRFSKEPEVSDYITYIDKTYDPVYPLTEEEQKKLIAMLSKP